MSKYVVISHFITEDNNVESNFHEFNTKKDMFAFVEKRADEQHHFEMFARLPIAWLSGKPMSSAAVRVIESASLRKKNAKVLP